jgi:hypothetical protein
MNVWKYAICAFLVLCFGFAVPASHSIAGEPFKLIIYANDEDGFHDKDRNVLNNEVWKVAKGTEVEIVFIFDGNMDPAEEEEHEIHMSLLRYADGKKPKKKLVVKRTKPLSATNLEQTISFTAGEFNEKILKIYCKTDCDGMDYMDNLRIEVD